MTLDWYQEGDKVTIHSIGPNYVGQEFRAIVRGIGIKESQIYIVEIVDKFDQSYQYSHCLMPGVCLRRGWKE